MLLEEGMNIKVMLLPDGDDPDSFARKHNATEFQEYIAAHEVDFIRFKTNLLMTDAGNDPYKRAGLIKDIVKSISVIPEAIVRSEYIKECSQMLHVEERILVSEVAKLKKDKEESQAKREAPQRPPLTPPKEGNSDDTSNFIPLPQENLVHIENPASTAIDTPIAMTESPSLGGVGEAINPLYPKERLIVQQLIRHGEKVMFIDEETQQQVLVAEYVASELEMDEITFTTPLFDEVLRELQQHLGEEGFVAERHFVNHANPELSRLAVDLIEEKYQLSKYHSKTQTVVREVDRLSELVSHLMVDYKHSLVELELKDTLNKLRQPDVMSDAEKCLEVMSRYKELMEIKQQMAKHLGDRVIG
jgi:DNA primase